VDPSAIARLFEDTLVYVDYDGSLMNKAEYLRRPWLTRFQNPITSAMKE